MSAADDIAAIRRAILDSGNTWPMNKPDNPFNALDRLADRLAATEAERDEARQAADQHRWRGPALARAEAAETREAALREALTAAFRLNEQASMSPRPWRLIWDEGPAVGFSDGKPRGTCMRPDTLRIVDDNNCLLVHIKAAPEQTLKPEDMQLIVESVNGIARAALATSPEGE